MAIIDYEGNNSYISTSSSWCIKKPVYYVDTATTATTTGYYHFSNFEYGINDAPTGSGTSTYLNYIHPSDAHLYIHTNSVEWQNWKPLQPTPLQKLQEIIRQRQFPTIIRSRESMKVPSDIREIRARQTLRRVVGEDQFRNFLKHGFVSLRAKSGRIYQIFPGYKFTNVYEAGKMVEKLCVVLDGNFPPTDSVIVRYLMLLNDEGRFIKTAKQWAADTLQFRTKPAPPTGNLQDILRQLQAA